MVYCGFPRSHEICIYRNLDDSCHYPTTEQEKRGIFGECVFGSKFVINPLAEFVRGLTEDDKDVLRQYIDGGGI